MVQIDPRTRMGAVGLSVSDLARSLEYYEHGIGLKLHKAEDGMAVLGTGGEDLLVLTEQAAAIPVQPSYTGLYHFALLLPSRLELARTIRHLMATNTPIGGASDHGVSEALYLSDPDGHGIEIYRDRPSLEWPIVDGELQMTVDPLAYDEIMAELEVDGSQAWEGLDSATAMGHIHLQVSAITEAESFYVNILGFNLIQRYGGSASFVSAGGYHHHLGLNTWKSRGGIEGAVSPPLRQQTKFPSAIMARSRLTGFSERRRLPLPLRRSAPSHPTRQYSDCRQLRGPASS